MSLQSHIAELARRHQALDKEIQVVKASHAVDDLRVIELKRKKLVLKDEMEKLRH